MAKQKLFYFQAYDQRQQWQKGSLVAQSKQAAQFQLSQKVLVKFVCNKIGN